MSRRLVVLFVLCALGLLAAPSAAAAHPLGNFTVNHFNGLTLYPDRIDLRTVIDLAEIPTVQERPAVDGNGDDTVSPAEADAYAGRQCERFATATTVTVGDDPHEWRPAGHRLEFPAGEAGLPTTRLLCEFTTAATLDRPATIEFRDTFRADRIGWHELVVTGEGVRTVDSTLPATSVSDELRAYPEDLLADPLDVRAATIRTERGTTDGGAAVVPGTDPSVITSATSWFTSLAGSRDLTPLVGVLALLLSLVLGASHAALPGHGKTVIAAYLAGKNGSVRDAVTVGATVTVTHTAGVLVLGLLISGSSAVAGESVLSWLGVASGLLVTVIGALLLRSALRTWTVADEPVLAHAGVVAGHELRTPARNHGHERSHGHGHEHGHAHGHGLGHGHGHGRSGLIGMGVAGGLVPSPSALVVLLGAIALGRTWFGVLLVLGYGLGMAITLTLVGILLVRLRDRFDRLPRVGRQLARLRNRLPVLTATLVLVVGLGLAVRAATSIP